MTSLELSQSHKQIKAELRHDIIKFVNNQMEKPSTGPTSVDSEEENEMYEWTEGELIGERYRAVGFLGDGAFGRVLEVVELATDRAFALKIVMPVEDNIETAKIESKILQRIGENSGFDEGRIVRMIETFHHNENFCIVFEKLGKSLRDILEINEFKPLPVEHIQYITKQILDSLLFLRGMNLVHTDLKPENILFEDQEL
jgi:dual-specificity kinase